jgi:peptidoglycan/LPS O-acetylase OafA/YrhL
MSSPTPSSGTRDRELGIDLLRGLSIMGVIIFHFWAFTEFGFGVHTRHQSGQLIDVAKQLRDLQVPAALHSAAEVLLNSMRDSIIVFIILSGTTLTMAALRGHELRPLAFYRRRFGPLMRAYWAGCAIFPIGLFLLAIPRTMIDGGDFWHNTTHLGLVTYYDRDQFFAGLALLPRLFTIHWRLAPPNSLWFIALVFQYYLLFPYLYRFASRFGFPALLAGSLVLSIVSQVAFLWWFHGHPGFHTWIIQIWSPFRVFEFALGMALGYVLVRHKEEACRMLGSGWRTALFVIAGIAIYSLGTRLDAPSGYSRVLAFPLIATAVVVLALPILVKRPGQLEAHFPGRLLIWIGPMSIAVVMMNEPFRHVDNYLWFKHLTWTTGWWIYVVAIYFPGTLITGALVARILKLTPPGHPTELLRRIRAPGRAALPQDAVLTG